MKHVLTIWCRELSACFLSPVAYVLMVVFLVMASGTFLIETTGEPVLNQPLSVALFESIVVWLTLLVTVVSMRVFAEEKRSGTLETLMTVPVTESQIVLGKFAGSLSFLVIVTLPIAATLFLLIALSPSVTMADLDVGALMSGGLILALICSLLLSVGLLVSLLTRNQIIAAVCCFSAVWGVLLFGWIVTQVTGGMVQVSAITVTDHLRDFARGTVDTRPLVLYLSATAFFLFASVRILESKRWR